MLAAAGLATGAFALSPAASFAPAPAPAASGPAADAGVTHRPTDLAAVSRTLRRLAEQRRRERLRTLRGRRTVDAAGLAAAELETVLRRTRDLAAAGRLHADRLPAQLLTVRRNIDIVRSGAVPGHRERVTWPGDPVVYERYAGEGLQIQWLGTWGRVNWMARRCVERPRECPRGGLARRIDRLVALASSRGGLTAWEYRFGFGGGSPPWVSAITQGTAAQALARAGTALEDPALHRLARSAVGALATPPPVGVGSTAPEGGAHYLMYSFNPGLRVLNGHVQALVALHDVAEHTGSRHARRLFRRGERGGAARLRAYDTGAWSLYSAGGSESSLAYHQLATGFMENLCDRVSASPYCAASRRFVRYEHEPPRLGVALPRTLRATRPAPLRVDLSKVSSVSVRAEGPAGPALLSSARLTRGAHAVAWVPPRAGRYRLVVDATDLAGNRSETVRIVQVRPGPRKQRPPARRPPRHRAR